MTTNDHPFLDPVTVRSTDSLPVRTTTPDLIDLDRVVAHINDAVQRGRYHGPTEPVEYLLGNQCLVRVGAELYATLAGLLCFGRNPQALFPQAAVDIGHYRGAETVSYEVVHLEKGIGGTLFEQLARVESYLWTNTHHGMTLAPGSLQRVEVHEYPQAVLRELILNLIAHRDYANFMSTSRVQLFRNRIEWVSPGGLLPGITIDNLLAAQQSRNPYIMAILYQAGYVESFGQGLDTVVSVLEREGMAPARFEDTGANFIVTVYGRSLDVFSASEVYGKLNDSQRLVLEFIRAKGEATPGEIATLIPQRSQRSRQRDLEGLIMLGLVQGLGAGRTMRYVLADVAS